MRWTVWSVYTAAWTTALLTPQPAEFAQATFEPEAAFTAAKSLHVCAYTVLTLLCLWLRPARFRAAWLLFPTAHALATEYLQGYVPLRTPSWEDVAIDHVGIVIGLAVMWIGRLRHAPAVGDATGR